MQIKQIGTETLDHEVNEELADWIGYTKLDSLVKVG